MNDELILNQ